MRVYVAGASREFERAEGWIRQLEKIGVEITHDWTKELRVIYDTNQQLNESYKLDIVLPDDEAHIIAIMDADAIIRSQLIWVLASNVPSTGMWFEFGYACMASRSPDRALDLLISGDGLKRCVFSYLDHVQRYETDLAAFEAIEELHQKK